MTIAAALSVRFAEHALGRSSAPGIATPPDYTPAPPAPVPEPARDRLEAPFAPARGELASFLVNALYLFGPNRVLEWEPADAAAAGDLRAAGHAVEAFREGGEPPAAGRYDRAMLVSRAMGYTDAEADGRWLAAMRRALRPGGLLLFPVFDRDRAWALAGAYPGGEGDPGGRADFAFDPGSGRVSARIRDTQETGPAGAPVGGKPAPGRRASSARAFNLAEVRALLAGAGLVLERAYGSWAGAGLAEGNGRILVVASKPRRAATKGTRAPSAARRERGVPRNGINKGGRT